MVCCWMPDGNSLVWHGGDSGCPHAGPDLISDDTSQVFHGCESWTTPPLTRLVDVWRETCANTYM